MSISLRGVAIGLSLSAQAYVLYYAYHYGVLRGLILWDDCGVILRGFENLDRLAHTESLMHALRPGRFEIHAPLSDVQAPIGLLLSGGQIWGPYLLNVICPALVLVTILQTVDRQNWALAVAIVLFIFVQPLTINAQTYVVSDWKGGLLLAGALFLLNFGVEEQRPDFKLLAATLLGLAILSKLTAFYLPLLALVILLLFEWYSAIFETWQRFVFWLFGTKTTLSPRPTLTSADRRTFALRATIAVCPFLLFFVYSLESTTSYIQSAMGSFWDDGLTTLERALYYSPFGPDAGGSWGTLHAFFLIFVGAALWIAWRRRDHRYFVSLLILALLSALFFIPLIVYHDSHSSFGATFLGVIMATTLISMDFIARSLPGRGSLAILATTVLIALPSALPFQNGPYASSYSFRGDELRQLAYTYARIVDIMSVYARRETPAIVVLYEHNLAPYPNLAIRYFQKTGHLANVTRVDDFSDIGVRSLLLNADFALTIVPNPKKSTQLIPGLGRRFPTSHAPERAEELIHTLGRFDLVDTFAVRGGEIHLYAAVKPSY